MSRARAVRQTAAWIALLAWWALAAAGVAPAQAASAGPGGEITPGKGVGGITLGMTVNDLFRLWGPPARTERDPDGVVLFDYGDARGTGVFVAGDRVSQIMVVTPDWSTPNGIKVGSTRPEVLAFFGRPDAQFPGQTRDETRIYYRRNGLVIAFKDRSVVGITVVPAEAPEAPKGLEPDDPAVRKPFLPTPTPPGY